MGSRGSVIPLFKKQILENKKITVTDPDMSRFMMSLSQAVKLMMKSCEVSRGGEVFVLKMPVVNLGDLAEVVIEETCKKYSLNHKEIKTEIIGFRAGERIYEELMTKEESHYAKDLGDMYAVFSTTYGVRNSEYYDQFKSCEIGNYSSEGKDLIHKEKVRELLLNEG